MALTSKHDLCLKWCFDNHLIATRPLCPVCESPMKIVKNLSIIDLCRWECLRRNTHNCKGARSIRSNSFFENSKLALQELIRLIFEHFLNHKTVLETKVSTDISYNAIGGVFREIKIYVIFYTKIS